MTRALDPAKREALIRAGIKLFAARGFHGTSVPDVAKAASVSVGTLYRYFDSKEDLVNVIFRQHKAELFAITELPYPPEMSFLERLRIGFAALFDWAAKSQDAAHFLYCSGHYDYLDAESLALKARVLFSAYSMFETAAERGELRLDPKIALIIVWGSFIELVRSMTDKKLEVDDTVIQAVIDGCWAGLKP